MSDETWPPPLPERDVAPAPPNPNRETVSGWLGVGLAVGGFLLPWLAFTVVFNRVDATLNRPEMDGWEIGPGAAGLRVCQTVITGLELAALGLGMRARRTLPGKLIFLLAPSALCAAWPVLSRWYLVCCHFT